MKYIKEFEEYKLNGEQVYCIYVPNKVNTAFTIGKYYDVYQSFLKGKRVNSTNGGINLMIKNDNGTLKVIYNLNNFSGDFWIPSINDILEYSFPVYVILGSSACFIRPENIEEYNIVKDIKGDARKYNL